jgi:predicted nucleotidyltransferase
MKLQYDNEAVRQFCRERGIARLELFGSALRDDFRAESDVDLLCTLKRDDECTLLGWADMQFKLTEIFGRPVDLVSRWAIERSRNPYRRQAILSTAKPIYVEG